MKKPIATGSISLLQRCSVSHMNPEIQRWLLNNLLPQSNMQNAALSSAIGKWNSHASGFINHTLNLIKIICLVSYWKCSRSLWIWDKDDHGYILIDYKFKAIDCQTKRNLCITRRWNSESRRTTRICAWSGVAKAKCTRKLKLEHKRTLTKYRGRP
jgi:hypothetical protein